MEYLIILVIGFFCFILFALITNACMKEAVAKTQATEALFGVIDELPIHETITLPKRSMKDSRWFIKTFERPRKK